ncbi:MAG: bifunctional riboflavin kinase/FAD synthetase [Christensenella sp.]|nr:bifunctional riboflavin kinase/FAD synthetase [Christensenella sp.]
MEIITENKLPLYQPTAVAIGLFDGLHQGHLSLIEDIREKRGLLSLVYTFDSKPNHAAFKNIYTQKEKLDIFRQMKIDAVFTQTFDYAFSQMTREEFIQRLVCDFRAKHIAVGFDFRFGKNAHGNAQFLEEQAQRYGYSVSILPQISDHHEKISSSRIRSLITLGDMEAAARLLGRYYFVDGTIERGNHLGAKIGFPTANISTDKLLPQYGVYATIVEIDGKLYRSVTNVGIKPTIKDDDVPNIETFIFDFSGDVYDEKMRVYFIEKIRDEKTFPNIDALQAEIAKNARQAEVILANLDVYKKHLV